MAGKGPPPLPTKILRARGSPLAKQRVNEPEPPPGKHDKPSWLLKEARQAWMLLTDQLDQMGMATKVDSIALARYCAMWEEWQKCIKVIRKQGALIPKVDKAGNVSHEDRPEVARMLKLGEQMLKLEREFGLTPSARAAMAGRIKKREAEAPQTKASSFFGKASG